MRNLFNIGARIVFGLLIFAVLVAAILMRPPKGLSEFDQAFYLSVAYDLNHHGVFSNGVIDDVDSTIATPPPGMFFGPLYPWLIVGVTKFDERFAKTVDCGVEAHHGKRPATDCEIYVRPMHIIHALLLTLGVLAVARAAEVLFAGPMVFWLAGVLASGTLLADANQFSFLMTESTTFSLYSLTMLAMVMGWTTSKRRYFVMAGVGLGLLCLARFSFLVTALIMPALIFINARFVARPPTGGTTISVLTFTVAFLAVVLPWATRNDLRRKIRLDRGIRVGRARRAVRIRPDDRARVFFGLPLLHPRNRPERRPARLRGGRHSAFPVRPVEKLLSDWQWAALDARRRAQAARPDHRRSGSL